MSRIITFPEDRLIGYLHIKEDDDKPIRFHGRFKQDGELLPGTSNPGWQLLGEARGRVEVPDDVITMLEVLPDEACELSPLSQLGPDDLQALWLGNTLVDDDELVHVGQLTGLRWIDVQNNGDITDAGIAHLKQLTNLTWFGAHWTRVTAASLGYLAAMPQLTYVDIWGCEIPPEAVTELKSKLPECEVRTQ